MISAREWIAHLPAEQRERFAALVRAVPASMRYGPVFRRTMREIRKCEAVPSWGRDERAARLRALFTTAVGTTYYGTTAAYAPLREFAADPDRDPFAVLYRLPVLTREELSANTKDMIAVDPSQVELVASSGTSGDPILFHLEKERGAGEWAYVQNAWHRSTGYELDDWRLFLRGVVEFDESKDHLVQAATGEVVLRIQALGPERIAEHWKLVTDRKIRYLHGYPASLEYMARLLETHLPEDQWRHQIKGVLAVSEEYTPSQAATFRRVFPQANVCNFYGLSERTAFATMDRDWVFHPEPLYGITEILKEDGTPAQVGERGRIVTTGLRLMGHPFLRYDTGDSAEVVGHNKWGEPTFRDIKARRGREGLIRADGSLFPTTSLNVHGHQFLCVNRFRFRQDEPGKVVLMLEPSATATQEELEDFYAAMIRRTKGQVELGLEIVDQLEVPPNGKNRLVDQNIQGVVSTWA
ncbi:phenylacetate--CoA ligase family protein [Kocuria soli]|uniref:Phenylacetate--CoA ligase family protein n=2 Tax=Kocuria soli TaxID=2485125 RepID=A0A3N3ZPZ4_9MICC|nr:phenylacetate--CoA ligase family protein [Kocuria soli]